MTDRSSARLVGALFIVATVSGVAGLALQPPDDDMLDYLDALSDAGKVIPTSALLTVVMAVAVAAIPIAAFPVLRRASQRCAIGYIVARATEGFIIAMDAVALLVLAAAAGSRAAHPGTGLPQLAEFVTWYRDAAGHTVLDIAVFPVGALIFNAVLFRARLVPRWLSTWGLAGAGVYLLSGVLVLYGLEPMSPIHLTLAAPLAVAEMVLAMWLIVKGFTTANRELPE